MLSGIYKFTNKANGKIYIGQAANVDERLKRHFLNHNNSNLKDYNTYFYRSLRKYGWDNFEIETIENVEIERLNEREEYWVSYYDSFKQGYNGNRGGESVTERAEEHPMAKLTNEQVLQIKEVLLNTKELQEDICKRYNVCQTIISQINLGKKWSSIGDYSYPIRPMEGKKGEDNWKSIFTDEEVVKIRTRYTLESGKKIYEDYKDICSYTTLERVLIGKTFSHLPVYSKKTKQWINK